MPAACTGYEVVKQFIEHFSTENASTLQANRITIDAPEGTYIINAYARFTNQGTNGNGVQLNNATSFGGGMNWGLGYHGVVDFVFDGNDNITGVVYQPDTNIDYEAVVVCIGK